MPCLHYPLEANNPKQYGSLKNMGLGKFFSQNPEAIVMGLEVSFLGQDFASHGLSLEFWNQALAVFPSHEFTILYPLYPLPADKHKSI